MSDKNGRTKRPASNPDQLPEYLAAIVQQGGGEVGPTLDTDLDSYPALCQVLSPRIVCIPPCDSYPKGTKVLREPLLSISWDRGLGAWRWSISDKVLNRRVSGAAAGLMLLLSSIENCLKDGTAQVKVIKPERGW
jgi:hypothetical protein